jgi:hypothetical protein
MQKAPEGVRGLPHFLAGSVCTNQAVVAGWQHIKKASAVAGLKGGASKRYFFISSFFVASFTFAFPIFTDTT